MNELKRKTIMTNKEQLWRDIAVADTLRERENQDKKWGQQEHDLPVWMLILHEETGELSEAILHSTFGGPKRNEVFKEAVQVSAVALQIVEYLRRKMDKPVQRPVPTPAPCCGPDADEELEERSEKLLREVLIHMQDVGIRVEPRQVYPILRSAFATLRQPCCGCAGLRAAFEKLFVHAKEFISDWRKGDFELGALAACDARSLESQLKQASEALASHPPCSGGKSETADEHERQYLLVVAEALKCDPIPACLRLDNQLEPPWEVMARMRRERDQWQARALFAEAVVRDCRGLFDLKEGQSLLYAIETLKARAEKAEHKASELIQCSSHHRLKEQEVRNAVGLDGDATWKELIQAIVKPHGWTPLDPAIGGRAPTAQDAGDGYVLTKFKDGTMQARAWSSVSSIATAIAFLPLPKFTPAPAPVSPDDAAFEKWVSRMPFTPHSPVREAFQAGLAQGRAKSGGFGRLTVALIKR